MGMCISILLSSRRLAICCPFLPISWLGLSLSLCLLFSALLLLTTILISYVSVTTIEPALYRIICDALISVMLRFREAFGTMAERLPPIWTMCYSWIFLSSSLATMVPNQHKYLQHIPTSSWFPFCHRAQLSAPQFQHQFILVVPLSKY